MRDASHEKVRERRPFSLNSPPVWSELAAHLVLDNRPFSLNFHI